jgi:hypothetical protein
MYECLDRARCTPGKCGHWPFGRIVHNDWVYRSPLSIHAKSATRGLLGDWVGFSRSHVRGVLPSRRMAGVSPSVLGKYYIVGSLRRT